MSADLEGLIRAIVREEVERAVAELRREPEPALMRIADAARHASTSARTVRRWIHDGKLTARGTGRVVLVDRAELAALLAGRGRRRAPGAMSPEELARRDFG